MIRFFRKLFKRGDFMTRADKAYYKYRAKTFFWSAFCLIIISWVGTNLVLCALTTNVKSGGDIIYAVPRDVYLPKGAELAKAIKKSTNQYSQDRTIKTITFDYMNSQNMAVVAGVEPEAISVDDNINLYRVNNGADVYILSSNNMYANQDLSSTFYALNVLTQIKFNNFNFKNVVFMDYLFSDCKALSSLDIKNWDVSSVTDMHGVFRNCAALTTLDLSGWNTGKVTTMENIFEDAQNLETIKGLESWNVKACKKMDYMFSGCDKIKTLDLHNWDVSAVTDMGSMFSFCDNLISLDLSGWNTRNVTNMGWMFSDSVKLTTIYASANFVTSKLTNKSATFSFCYALRGGKGTTFNENHIDADYARIDGGPSSATPGYFTAK